VPPLFPEGHAVNAAEIVRSLTAASTLTRGELVAARADTPKHIAGRSISRRTYTVHGCHCPGCTAATTRETTASKRRRGVLPPESTKLPPLVAQVRRQERLRRESLARQKALRALADAHPDEYRRLLADVKAAIAVEAGPLPGDHT
jgi:hypothetical protein